MVLSYHETEKIETENRRLLLNQSIINGINLREQGNDKRCDYVLFVGLKRLIKRKLSDAWTEDKYWKKSPAAARSGRLQRTQEILDGKEDLHDALLPFTAVNLAPR